MSCSEEFLVAFAAYVKSFEVFDEDLDNYNVAPPLPTAHQFLKRMGVSITVFKRWLKIRDDLGNFINPRLICINNELVELQGEFLIQHGLKRGYDSKFAIHMLSKMDEISSSADEQSSGIKVRFVDADTKSVCATVEAEEV